jgi:aryl-alcohol dehydrogenase-like predicted oxidoreductase/adenylate kinase family enzyme
MEWLSESELRIGLGCMRLSTDADRDDERSFETIAAAVAGGVTVFDTAHAYGLDDTELGHNERLLAAALRRAGAASNVRIVTKGGMTRPGGAWVPDGRAVAVRRDCEASLAALGDLPIDLYLLHAPDPRVPWVTSIRALARLIDDGLVSRVGVSNVNRQQLDQALDIAPISAVQVALNPYDDTALRGGVVARCTELGIAVMAHTPLGGVRRAASGNAAPAEHVLAWLLSLSPSIVAIPGARRPQTARSAAHAATITLTAPERERFSPAQPATAKPAEKHPDVVVVMGIPGSGKSRIAAGFTARRFQRLNRDERGGSLKQLAAELDEQLGAGATRVVLDNTYLTRALRSYVLDAAARHHARTTCIWLDIPLAQAQVNMVERLLERFDGLPSPDELRMASRKEPWLLSPTAQMRTMRELEPPTTDEGWDELTQLPFVREPATQTGVHGVFVSARVLAEPGWERAVLDADPAAPHLLFDWRPNADVNELASLVDELRTVVSGSVDAALCPHPAGPPICWCRPPLPGLLLAFARARAVDVTGSPLVGVASAHRQLATALDATYVSAAE